MRLIEKKDESKYISYFLEKDKKLKKYFISIDFFLYFYLFIILSFYDK